MEHHVKIDSKYGLEKVTYFVASFYEEAFLLRNTFYNTSCTFAISVDAFHDFFKSAESHLNREKLRARGGNCWYQCMGDFCSCQCGWRTFIRVAFINLKCIRFIIFFLNVFWKSVSFFHNKNIFRRCAFIFLNHFQ